MCRNSIWSALLIAVVTSVSSEAHAQRRPTSLSFALFPRQECEVRADPSQEVIRFEGVAYPVVCLAVGLHQLNGRRAESITDIDFRIHTHVWDLSEVGANAVNLSDLKHRKVWLIPERTLFPGSGFGKICWLVDDLNTMVVTAEPVFKSSRVRPCQLANTGGPVNLLTGNIVDNPKCPPDPFDLFEPPALLAPGFKQCN